MIFESHAHLDAPAFQDDREELILQMKKAGISHMHSPRYRKESPDVKPCPFCGQKPVIQRDFRYPGNRSTPVRAYTVICTTSRCPIEEADNTYFLTKKEAILAWNTRAYE